MKKNWDSISRWILRWVPVLLGLAWIIFPDPIVGPIDDILVAVLEIVPIITQAVNKIHSNQ